MVQQNSEIHNSLTSFTYRLTGVVVTTVRLLFMQTIDNSETCCRIWENKTNLPVICIASIRRSNSGCSLDFRIVSISNSSLVWEKHTKNIDHVVSRRKGTHIAFSEICFCRVVQYWHSQPFICWSVRFNLGEERRSTLMSLLRQMLKTRCVDLPVSSKVRRDQGPRAHCVTALVDEFGVHWRDPLYEVIREN